MGPGHVEWAHGMILWVQDEFRDMGRTWVCRMCPGLGVAPAARGGCRALGVAVGQGDQRLGMVRVWGGCEQDPPGLTPSARGAGLPGAGVRGAGGGDRVPAGPPGESPHGDPREAVRDHPAAGRGAEQLQGHRHDAAVRQQAGQEGLFREIRPLPRLLPQQRGRHLHHLPQDRGGEEHAQPGVAALHHPRARPLQRGLRPHGEDRRVRLGPGREVRPCPQGQGRASGHPSPCATRGPHAPPRSHDFIGEFATSYRELSRAQSQFTVYEVLNPRKKCKKKKYVNSGTVTLLSFSVESEFTFVDYIRGGTQLNFTVAIDFTASNGMPSQPTSLHYASPYQLSAYALALKAVGEIIQDYDSDKLFPAYGFGAKLPPDGKISHQFPLNNNEDNPSCAGIEGVLESYLQSLRTVQLYGPTNFAPVINQVAGTAAQVTDGSQYHVLLIITDGVISDMLQTKEAIVTASALPMSIIIVGVGPAEFDGEQGSGQRGVPEEGTGLGDTGAARTRGAERCCPPAMEELDGDEVRVSSRGRYAERDIVQVTGSRGRRAGGGGAGSGTRCPSALEQPPAGTAGGMGWPRDRVPCRGAGLEGRFPAVPAASSRSSCRSGTTWTTRATRC
ncbi:copine-9 isoform X1 [Cygnus olor]|uniref:copine-9 isoform X1 n=1 Tax=Cygnus olor TaxID=8869 RepID=UPI001ADE227E|nr:copine-9 isoform X1 [Cygnus olor]